MARKRFKLSKSILARFAAIGVLSAMGGLAIYQTQMGGKKEDESGLAKKDKGKGEGDDDSQDVDEGSDDEDNANSDNSSGNGGLISPSTGSSNGNNSNNLPPTRTVGTDDSIRPPGTGPPGRSTHIGDQSNGQNGGSGLTAPGTTRPSTTPPGTSPANTSPGSGNPAAGLTRPGTTPPGITRPSTSPPSTAPPSTAPPSTAPPSTAPPSTTPPSTTPPSTAPPSSSIVRTPSDDTDANGQRPPALIGGPSNPSNSNGGLSRPGTSGSTISLTDTETPDPLRPGTTIPGSTRLHSTNGEGSGSVNESLSDSDDGSRGSLTLPGTSPGYGRPNGGTGSGSSSIERPSGFGNDLRTTGNTPDLSTPGQDGNSPNPGGNNVSTEIVRNQNSGSNTTSQDNRMGTIPPRFGGNSGNNSSGYGSGSLDGTGTSRTPQGTGSISSGNSDPGTGSTRINDGNSYNSTSPYGGYNRDRSNSSYPNTNLNTTNNSTHLASDTPGGVDVDGPQAPSLVVEKRAPREIQVGRVATFETIVSNVGSADAVDVIVTDRIPAGTRLESVDPQPISSTGGLLIWNLGTVEPGREQTISMNLRPERKGEIGSVAQVTFNAQVGVRTICTQPTLEVNVQAPESVLIGQDITMRITVTNTGDGAASNVVIEEDVPSGVSHPEGREIQYPVGTLAPGESRQLALTLRAESAAEVRNIVTVRGDNQLFDEAISEFEVVAPKIEITMTGPNRRYLERTAIHRIQIENKGTASATNVEIVAHLPKGLRFQETNNHGTYDPNTHAVYWGLEQLPAGALDNSIQLVTLPVETGDQTIDYQATADLNLADTRRMPVAVEELAELFFDVDDVADPIEVGSETLYHVRVTNQGSKVATQVHLQVQFPPELQPTSADGPVRHTVRQQIIDFDPIERIAPGEEVLLKITALGQRAGDHRVVVQLLSAESSQPVLKQASTTVYTDR